MAENDQPTGIDPEVAEIQDMLAEKGIEVDFSDDEPPTYEGQEEAEPTEEAEPAPPPPPAEVDDEAHLSPAQRGFKRRETARRMKSLEEENQGFRALFQRLRSMAPPPAQAAPAAPAQAAPEELPDPLENPDAYFEARSKPLLDRIAQLEQEAGRRRQEDEGRTRDQRAQEIMGRIEEQHEQHFPGYRQRAAEFRQTYISDMEEIGVPRHVAERSFGEELGLIFRIAAEQNMPPQIMHELRMKQYLGRRGQNGSAEAPAAAAPPRPKPSARIAHANRAAASPSAGSLSEGAASATRSGGLDPNVALTEGFSMEQVTQLLSSPGGREKYWKLMRDAERLS